MTTNSGYRGMENCRESELPPGEVFPKGGKMNSKTEQDVVVWIMLKNTKTEKKVRRGRRDTKYGIWWGVGKY